jgi:hypothetical protein
MSGFGYTSHGAARIMIELRNKHTLTGKLCCFQIVLCAQHETVLNMTTAKALGLDGPTSILLSARTS